MMKQKDNNRLIRLAVTPLLPLVLLGCSDEMQIFRPDDGASGLRFELQASIDQQNDTRADESGFADGDRFGLFVVNYSGGEPGKLTLSDNQVNNVAIAYNANAGSWQSATDIYWRDPITPADVYGYYPFYNGMSDVNNYSFEVRADQSVKSEGEMSAYEASDFLWAKTPKATPGKKVELTFSHIMAGVKVILEQGSGFDGDLWTKLEKTITVDNTIRTSEVDLSTGIVMPTGSFDRNVVMNPEGDAWRAVVVPQTVAAGKSIIGITIDGKPYVYTRADGMKYSAGKLHTFTIKIDRKADGGDYTLTLINEDITPWEADKSSHDFESNSYLVVHVAEAGTLKKCLEAKHADAGSVRNLKISGELTDEDFRFIREEMWQLSAINLKDTRIVDVKYRDYTDLGVNSGYRQGNDILPDEAFRGVYTLRRIILPDSIKWLGDACMEGLTLSSTIIIPESVTVIECRAFCRTEGDFTIVLPSKLERIGENAFGSSTASIDLKLPKTLKSIDSWAFNGARNVHGVFSLPEGLTEIKEGAFEYCGTDLEGEIVIPIGIKEIPERAFANIGFIRPIELKLHDGVSKIGKEAFSQLRFSAPVEFPKDLVEIGERAFSECQFSGNLVLPSEVATIGEGAFRRTNVSGCVELPASLEVVPGSVNGWGEANGVFAQSQITQLNILDNVEIIGSYTCYGCERLRNVRIGKNVSFIGEHAFSECPGLETIVCLAATPPTIAGEAFRGLDLRHCVLEVPETSIEAYRHADGWKEIRSITPHHELNVSISEFSCLNKGISRSLVVRAEGSWEITECPDWIKITPDHAQLKEEITVMVNHLSSGSGNREGKVVFRLKDSGYTTCLSVHQYDYEYEEDMAIEIQKASGNGSPIPVFIVSDGYGAESIVSGEYMRRVNEVVEYLFAIEPYKSYRNMFSVSTAISLSPDDGAPDILSSNESKFGIPFPLANCPMFLDLIDGLRKYVIDVSPEINENNIRNALVVMLSNYNSFCGNSYDNADFSLACIGNSEETFPYDNRGLVQYFVGGLAFAGLANERVVHFEFLKGCTCPSCNALGRYKTMKSKGLYENVTISGKSEVSPWREFIFHPKYSSIVDMYEGGLDHLRGVWRSEPESVMSNYIPYYNTISRYAIYKQIMKRAGLTPSLEEFINNDKIEIPD